VNTRTIVFSVSCILFVIWTILFWDYSIDDAFITFRFAEHFADGYGLVFNRGDVPVEGYSNTLWLFLLALFYRLGFSTYLTAKIIGLLTSAVAGTVLFWNFRDDEHSILWLAGPIFLAMPQLAFWAVSGLELGLHALLVVVVFLTFLRQSRWAFLPLVLVVLSRPEGAPIAVVMIASMGLSDLLHKRLKLSYYLLALTVVLATVGALTLFRLQVFGYSFPNTYFAKTGQHVYGFDRLLEFLIRFAPLTLAFLWGWVVVGMTKGRDNLLTACLAVFTAQAVISASVDPVMNFMYRYLTPFVPLFLLAGLTMVKELKWTWSHYAFAGLVFLSSVTIFPEARSLQEWNREVIASQNKAISWIGTLPSLTTISMTDMGRIPYYTNKRYNDIWGLVDREIAHEGFNAIREFLHLPEYFVFVGHIESGGVRLRFGREQYITGGPHFSRCYQLERICLPDGVSATEPGYYYVVFKRNPDATRIVEEYGQAYWLERVNKGY